LLGVPAQGPELREYLRGNIETMHGSPFGDNFLAAAPPQLPASPLSRPSSGIYPVFLIPPRFYSEGNKRAIYKSNK
jgi:hypothetical protein